MKDIYVDGRELEKDTIAYVNTLKIEVQQIILNPSKPVRNGDRIRLAEIFCVEYVDYRVQSNSIQVSVRHTYENKEQATVKRYYGMQSMFEKESQVLTPLGRYTAWTDIARVDRFTKGEYPQFRRFIEKNTYAYQSSYLLKKGLGNHGKLSDNAAIFIGNSSNKSYHSLIEEESYKAGDSDEWSDVYTWFKKPILDNEYLFCYDGMIEDNNIVFIDCLQSTNAIIELPEKYTNCNFYIHDISPGMEVTKSEGTRVYVAATSSGSCVIVFPTDSK